MSIHIIQDNKFKNINVSVRFLTPISKNQVLPQMLLANILNESCQKYPTKQSVTDILDTMYGAYYNVSTSIIGKSQALIFKGQIIHPRFLKEENILLEQLFSLLSEFIKHPFIINELFDDKIILEAKRSLKDMILRGEEDPSTFSMYEAMRIAGENQPMGFGVCGTIEDVEVITNEQVYETYKSILKNAQVDIMVLGDVNKNEILTYIDKYFSFENLNVELDCSYCIKDNVVDKYVSKPKNISQSYITYMYCTNQKNDSKSFSALKVANAILGQLPTSLLFQEIREKHSLCYSIYSALFPYDGALGICTGVETGSEELVKKLIEEQVERIKNGTFSFDMIDSAKKMLVNSLRATKDHADSIFALIYRNILLNKEDTIEKMIEEINVVTKKDVMHAMQKCTLCVAYVLEGNINEKDM